MGPRKRLRQEEDDEVVAVESAGSSFQNDSVGSDVTPSLDDLRFANFTL